MMAKIIFVVSARPPPEKSMKQNLKTAELISKLEIAEKRIVELEQELAGISHDFNAYQRTAQELDGNEKRFRAMIENGLDDISLLDAHGNLVWESPSVVRNLGYESNRYIGRDIFELMHPEDQRWASDIFAKIVHEPGSRRSGTFRLQHASGSWRWMEAIITNLLEEPSVGAIVVNYRDVTERREVEEARYEAELRYRALFEQSHDAIFILDLAGQISVVNQRAAEILGYSHQELLELSIKEISAEPLQSQKVLQGLISGGHMPIYEHVFRKKDGGTFPVEINVELVRDVHGNPLHIQSVVRDITDRKQSEIELQHRSDDLGLINAINEVIVQGGNLAAVVQVLTKELKRIFASQGSAIYMLNPDQRSLTMQEYFLPSEIARRIEKLVGSAIPMMQIPIQEGGYFQKVLLSKRGQITSDPKEIQNWMAEYAEATFLPQIARSAIRKLIPQIYKLLNIKSTILVPLWSYGKAIGLLDVSSSGLFTDADLKRIENIAAQLTAAILRQQDMEKIERSEKFLQSVQNSLSASIAILDQTGTIVQVNSNWRKFGEQNGLIHPETCIGMNYLEVCDSASGPNSEEAPLVAQSIRDVINGHRKEAWVEYPCHSPEEKRWFILRITRFEAGDKVWVVLAHGNVTERVQAQDTLQRSEAILAQAGKMAHLGAWEIEVKNLENLADNPLHWSDEVYRIFGYEPDQVDVTNDFFYTCVHPEDRNRVQQALDQAVAENRPYEVEHRIIRPDGVERIVEEHADLIFNEQGQLIQILGAVQDITERKKIEANLKETSAQFRTLFEASPEAIMLIDPQGKWPILDCNAAACTMNGYTREELVGQSIDILNLPPGDDAGEVNYLEQVREAGILRYDDFHRRKDGSIFPIEVSTSLITLGGREVILGIDRDITERKGAEEALRESEALYRKAIEVAGAVPYYQSYSDHGNTAQYEFIGEGIRQITGYGPTEFTASLWDSLVEEIHLVEELAGYSLDEGIQQVRLGETPVWKCEHRIRDRDGKIHWVFEAAVELRDERGVAHGSIGTIQDITERKQAEDALRQSEQRYHALFEDLPVAIWEEDFSEVKKYLDHLKEEGVTNFRAYFESHAEAVIECESKIRILDVNNAAVRMYGAKSKDELLKAMQLKPTKAELEQTREVLISISEGKLNFTREFPDETMSDEPIEISMAMSIRPGYERDYSRVIVSTADITQRKRVERELRASEERFRQLADNIQEVFWMTDAISGEEIYISPAAEQVWGRPLDTLMQKDTFFESVFPEDRSLVLQALTEERSGKNTELEYRVRRPDGSVRWIWDRAFPILNDSGNVARIAGVAADITERKQAEDALRESEAKYRLLFESNPLPMWIFDLETLCFLKVNDAAATHYGYSTAEFLAMTIKDIRPPEDVPELLNTVARAASGVNRVGIWAHMKKDGSIIQVEIIAHRVDFDGRQAELVLANDITERMQAENALRESEMRFAGVVNTAMDAVISVDPEQNIVLFNPAAEQMFGYNAAGILGQPLERLIPSRHRSKHKEFPPDFGETGGTRRDMKHLDTLSGLRADGTEFPVEASISSIEMDGQPLYTAILRDITERKQAEEQLRKLSRAVEQGASSIVITDTQGQIEYINPKFTEVTGYTSEEVRGQNPRILQSGFTPPEVYRDLWQKITSGAEWHGELLNKKKNDELYWESVTISPILNEQKETTHFIAVKEDITERKQNEAEITRHLAELEALYVNGLEISRLLQPQAIGERIIQTFAEYLSWHHVTIRLCKEANDELELIAFHLPHIQGETSEAERRRMQSHVSRVGQGISGWVVQTGSVVRTNRLTEHPHYVQTYEGMQSGLYTPLKVGERVIGVISVESEARDAFSEQDERLLATLANQAATAFENARLYQSAQQEIWERRIAEDALRQSEENYRRLAQELEERVQERTAEVQDLYDNAPCGYHSLDPDGNILRINETELKWLGYAREEVLGHPIQDFITDESRRTFKEKFPAFKQSGSSRNVELDMLRKDGSIFPALISATAVYDKDGRYMTSRSTLSDDTDRKHAMETMQLANSEMKRAMRMKDEFLANMSHELRTPLNAILGLSESLLEQTPGPVNEKQQKYLNTINESGRHLLELINDILDLAKIESGQIKLEPGKVNIETVCESSLRMIKQLAQKKNQTVEVNIESDIGYVWADERRLKQMMVNLLSNAVKFTPDNGQIGLKVSIDRAQANLRITIWDHGIGIRQEDLKRLFQPFVQLDSSLSRESAGTGLGLALVAEMARLHGGSITVSSQLGQGSEFTIVLPWDPSVTTDTIDRLKITGKIPIIRATTVDKQTILLVEDTDSVVMMVRDYLELSGYKVQVARDGLDGVSKAIALRPDLILMDVQMPGLDGLEATRRIRQEASLNNVPIIALTALAMPSDRELCFEAGMNDYFSKPINLKELVKTMQRHLPLPGKA